MHIRITQSTETIREVCSDPANVGTIAHLGMDIQQNIHFKGWLQRNASKIISKPNGAKILDWFDIINNDSESFRKFMCRFCNDQILFGQQFERTWKWLTNYFDTAASNHNDKSEIDDYEDMHVDG
eukprot:UN04014